MRFNLGSWTPGFPAGVHRLMLVLMSVEVLVRGADYLTGDHHSVTQSLTFVEQAMPLPVWGALCLAAATLVLAGIIGRWHRWIIAGALLASGIYGGLAVGFLLRVVERGCLKGDDLGTDRYIVVWILLAVFFLASAFISESKGRRVVFLMLSGALTIVTVMDFMEVMPLGCSFDGYRTPAQMLALCALWQAIAYGTYIKRTVQKDLEVHP